MTLLPFAHFWLCRDDTHFHQIIIYLISCYYFSLVFLPNYSCFICSNKWGQFSHSSKIKQSTYSMCFFFLRFIFSQVYISVILRVKTQNHKFCAKFLSISSYNFRNSHDFYANECLAYTDFFLFVRLARLFVCHCKWCPYLSAYPKWEKHLNAIERWSKKMLNHMPAPLGNCDKN